MPQKQKFFTDKLNVQEKSNLRADAFFPFNFNDLSISEKFATFAKQLKTAFSAIEKTASSLWVN